MSGATRVGIGISRRGKRATATASSAVQMSTQRRAQARMLRLQKVGDRVAVNGNTHVAAAIAEKQNEIRAGLDDLARRFD